MLKLIIDYLGDAINEDILKLSNTLILISPDCQMPPNSISLYKELKDLDAPIPDGNFLVRTSDDCLRGVILGKITQKHPNVIIYSSRPETISRYIQKSPVEPWPNDLSSFFKFSKVTSIGPPVKDTPEAREVDVIKQQNFQFSYSEPKPLVRSQNVVLVEPLGPNNKVQIKPPQKPAEKRSFSDSDDEIDENNEVVKKYFENVFNSVTDCPGFRNIEKYSDLYSIVHRAIRDLGKPEILDIDNIRLKLIKLVCVKILELGFFSNSEGCSASDIVNRKRYDLKLIHTL